MVLYHCCTYKLLCIYLAQGYINNPVRAWRSLNGAERFSKQTDRKIILRLTGRGEFRELGGHQGEAMISDSKYKLTKEDL